MLREAGIPFEVVPGITAGIAAPAYAGIPVTHREVASARRVRHRPRDRQARTHRLAGAGRASPARSSSTWASRALPRIAEQLIAGGRPPDEPVAVVERGTLPGQRTVLATLADVAERAAAEGIRAPAITLVGAGRRAARAARVARAAAAARPHRRGHARAGAGERAGGAAARRSARRSSRRRRSASQPLDGEPLPPLDGYDLVCVTSPNGADAAARPRARRPRARRRARSPRSAPAPRARCARAGSSPTSCPSAPSPRGSSRRSPTSRSRARS